MNSPYLTQTIRVLLFFVLSFGILYLGREVLIPLAFGGILALLMIPVSRKLENKGWNKALAALISVVIIVAVLAGIILLLKWQAADVAKDMGNIEKRFTEMINEAKHFVNDKFGISIREQQKMIKEQQSGSTDKMTDMFMAVIGSFLGILVNIVLVLVYMYLFIYFRKHFKNFVMKLINTENKPETEEVMADAGKVTQKYLTGLGMMIVMLWVLYGIGFSIVGIKGAIFFAILCGILELVPFVGNLTGTTVTVLMAMAQGGEGNMVIGVLVTYGIVQFTQTYLLEPLVVGEQVNINPLFTILIIVIGETVWGIPGMILAIPMLGMIKIICDHVDPLKPYGYLIGTQKTRKQENFFTKIFARKES